MTKSDAMIVVDICNALISRYEMIGGKYENRPLVNEASKVMDEELARILEQCKE